MRASTVAMAFGLILGLSSFSTAYARPSLSPRSSSFTAKGQVTFYPQFGSVPCTAHFAGDTDASGYGHITSMTFTGSEVFCASITTNGLPALLSADTRKRGTLQSVGFTTMNGNCGSASPTIWINSSGRFYFDFLTLLNGNPGCVLRGYVKTTPAITIVKP